MTSQGGVLPMLFHSSNVSIHDYIIELMKKNVWQYRTGATSSINGYTVTIHDGDLLESIT